MQITICSTDHNSKQYNSIVFTSAETPTLLIINTYRAWLHQCIGVERRKKHIPSPMSKKSSSWLSGCTFPGRHCSINRIPMHGSAHPQQRQVFLYPLRLCITKVQYFYTRPPLKSPMEKNHAKPGITRCIPPDCYWEQGGREQREEFYFIVFRHMMKALFLYIDAARDAVFNI